MTNIAYHFTGNTLRDGSPIPPIGHTLRFPGELVICPNAEDLEKGGGGYHWSRRPSDALKYAPGSLLHKVRFGGAMIERHDKGVSVERTILATVDADYMFRRFAADQALSVAHLWDMPDVVREYLVTLDERKRAAAWAAADAAACAAAWAAACAAAWAAADAAAWAATDAATWDAARATADAAAWDAARATADAAAWAAAWAAARDDFDDRVANLFAEASQ